MSKATKVHPWVEAWRAFKAAHTECFDLATIGTDPKYLANRLDCAHRAGWDAAEAMAKMTSAQADDWRQICEIAGVLGIVYAETPKNTRLVADVWRHFDLPMPGTAGWRKLRRKETHLRGTMTAIRDDLKGRR